MVLQAIERCGFNTGGVDAGGRVALYGLLIRRDGRVHRETVVTLGLAVSLCPELSHCAGSLAKVGLKSVLQLFGDVQPVLQEIRSIAQVPNL